MSNIFLQSIKNSNSSIFSFIDFFPRHDWVFCGRLSVDRDGMVEGGGSRGERILRDP